MLSRQVARPCAALVSTNLTWIKFMQLRLDRVLKGEFEASGSLDTILASNPFEEEDILKKIGYAGLFLYIVIIGINDLFCMKMITWKICHEFPLLPQESDTRGPSSAGN